jgi:fatty-acyl-CoA synthase
VFLLEDPRINHVAVVGTPDPRLAEVPVAFVIREDGVDLSGEEVIGLCRGRLASFKIPRRVYFVDQFPMTGSGKVQKYLLREEAQRLFAAGSPPDPLGVASGDHEADPLAVGVAPPVRRSQA